MIAESFASYVEEKRYVLRSDTRNRLTCAVAAVAGLAGSSQPQPRDVFHTAIGTN